MFKVGGCLNVRHRRLTAGGSSDRNIFHRHERERERETSDVLRHLFTFPAVNSFSSWWWRWFHPPPTHPAAAPIGHDELRLSVTNGSRGWDLQTKEWTEEISRSQLYSRNRPSLQYMMKLQSTYSGASSLFPDVTSVGPPQVTLQDVSFGYVGTWGPDLQARGRRCLSGDYGSAKRNNTSKTTSHSVTAQSSQSCIIKLLLIHISVLTMDQSHSVGSHSTVWLHIFNLCFKTRVENAKNQLI